MSFLRNNCKCDPKELKKEIDEIRELVKSVRYECIDMMNSWGRIVTNLHDRVRRMEIQLNMDPHYCISCKRDIQSTPDPTQDR
jgi:hypothetical protein